MSATGTIFNISLGRVAEMHNRVQTQDPSTSRIGIMALAKTGLEDDSVLITKTTVSGVLAGSTNEAVNTNYSRIILTHSDLPALAPDQSNNWQILNTLANHSWSLVGAGDDIAKIVLYYIPISGTSTDSTSIPLTLHDFPITPNGENITIAFEGYYKAFADQV